VLVPSATTMDTAGRSFSHSPPHELKYPASLSITGMLLHTWVSKWKRQRHSWHLNSIHFQCWQKSKETKQKYRTRILKRIADCGIYYNNNKTMLTEVRRGPPPFNLRIVSATSLKERCSGVSHTELQPLKLSQTRKCMYNVTLQRVRATIVVVEKQRVLHNMSVC
jgi:hypothetical protein